MKRFSMAAVCLLVAMPISAQAEKVFTKAGKGATTWDCSKDPVVKINHGGANYVFKGNCTLIFTNAGSGKLTIESVDTLDINGAKNVVTVGTVGDIKLTGANNTVTWSKAKKGDEPKILVNSGVG